VVSSLATRLALVIVAMSLLSLLAATIVGVRTGRELGDDLDDDRLVALRSSGSLDVASRMAALGRSVGAVAASPQAVLAIEDLGAAFDQLADIPAADFARQQDQLRTVYEERYLDALEVGGRVVDMTDILVESAAGTYLQFHYATEEHAADTPAEVDDAGDGSLWSELHRVVQPQYREVVDRLQLNDMLLVEPGGNVVYSVAKRPDLGSNLEVGPFSGSVVARAYDLVVDDPSVGPVVVDLAFYEPALLTPVGAVAAPVLEGGRLAGVAIFLYDSAPFTDALTADGQWDDAGFPATGETYLFGSDGLLRSEPRDFIETPVTFLNAAIEAGNLDETRRAEILATGSTVLLQPAAEATLNVGLAGDDEVAERTSITGVDVLDTVAAVPVDGLDWYVVSEVSAESAEGDLADFEEFLIIGAAIFVVALTFVAVAWADLIVRPVRSISNRLASAERRDDPIDVPPRSPIEFQRLAASFETMSLALRSQEEQLAQARGQRLDLLRSMLPPAVADRIAAGDVDSLEEVPEASVVVVVIQGLGALVRAGDELADRDRIDQLHAELDDLAAGHGLERVKVVGDAYFAACGHDRPLIDHAPRSVSFAADAQDAVRAIGRAGDIALDVSVGVHTGPVTVGMTGGIRMVYDVWGATVTAAHSLARRAGRGQILVSGATAAVLPDSVGRARAGGDDEDGWVVDAASVGEST